MRGEDGVPRHGGERLSAVHLSLPRYLLHRERGAAVTRELQRGGQEERGRVGAPGQDILRGAQGGGYLSAEE